MVKRLQLFLALCLVLGSSRAYGDDPFNIAVKPEKLAFLPYSALRSRWPHRRQPDRASERGHALGPLQ